MVVIHRRYHDERKEIKLHLRRERQILTRGVHINHMKLSQKLPWLQHHDMHDLKIEIQQQKTHLNKTSLRHSMLCNFQTKNACNCEIYWYFHGT